MQFHKGSTTSSIFYPSIFRPRSIETAVQEEFIYKVENEIKNLISWITWQSSSQDYDQWSEYIQELYHNSVFRLISLIFLDFHQGWVTHNRIGVNCFFRNLFSFSLQSFAIYLCNRAKKSNYFFPVDFFSLFTFSVCDHSRDLQHYKFQKFLNHQKVS